jgi:nitrate/nitrite-specific signal transduction histidine kinase
MRGSVFIARYWVLLMAVLVAITAVSVWLGVSSLLLQMVPLGLLLVLLAMALMDRRGAAPDLALAQVRQWASEIRQGNFSARLPATSLTDTSELCDDINRLAEWLESLAADQEAQLQQQQSRLVRHSDRLLRFEDRSAIANELHDSLAQSLASLKMQVRVLDDTLRQDNEVAIWKEMENIQAGLDEANIELRELITYFRLPVDGNGVVSAIEKAVSRFRLTSSIEAVLQNHWPAVNLPVEYERQVLRIVQEGLANVRKHSGADMVRILLNQAHDVRRVLIEDDGVGMSLTPDEMDNHFGLSIMQERAGSIGATLQLESEPGDGTRIILTLPIMQDKALGDSV